MKSKRALNIKDKNDENEEFLLYLLLVIFFLKIIFYTFLHIKLCNIINFLISCTFINFFASSFMRR